LAAQDVGDRSGCIQLILSKIARRLVLPMMAANAVPPTSVFGFIHFDGGASLMRVTHQ
jgi:hypothetical protein